MVQIYYHSENKIQNEAGENCFAKISLSDIFWVDLHNATDNEIIKVQTFFNINFNKLKAENELESNARLYETEDLIFIAANFMTMKENKYENLPVFLTLLSNVLINSSC